MSIDDEAYQKLRHDFEQLPEAPGEGALSPAEAERQAYQHEQRLVWAKNEILIERARLDPFGYGFDGKYRSLWEVSDEAAEAKLRELDAARRAQQ